MLCIHMEMIGYMLKDRSSLVVAKDKKTRIGSGRKNKNFMAFFAKSSSTALDILDTYPIKIREKTETRI